MVQTVKDEGAGGLYPGFNKDNIWQLADLLEPYVWGGGGKVKKGKRETSCKLRKDLPQLKEDFMEFKTCVSEIWS